MNTMNQVYEVEIIRDRGAQGQRSMREFYVAPHINNVIAHLATELADQRAEVVKIQAVAPVLAVLTQTP